MFNHRVLILGDTKESCVKSLRYIKDDAINNNIGELVNYETTTIHDQNNIRGLRVDQIIWVGFGKIQNNKNWKYIKLILSHSCVPVKFQVQKLNIKEV